MKPQTTTAINEVEPLLSLQATVRHRDRDGQVTDVTNEKTFGLKAFAEDGALALYILEKCRRRLDLLSLAAESRPSIDASLVRLAVDELIGEFDEAGALATYVRLTHELFSNSEALTPRQAPHARTAGRALSRTAAH
jgi:hypothetical protein